MFIVTVTNKEIPFFLRGTTWAFVPERADLFPTQEAAQSALLRAKQFMKLSLYKQVQIIPVPLS